MTEERNKPPFIECKIIEEENQNIDKTSKFKEEYLVGK